MFRIVRLFLIFIFLMDFTVFKSRFIDYILIDQRRSCTFEIVYIQDRVQRSCTYKIVYIQDRVQDRVRTRSCTEIVYIQDCVQRLCTHKIVYRDLVHTRSRGNRKL